MSDDQSSNETGDETGQESEESQQPVPNTGGEQGDDKPAEKPAEKPALSRDDALKELERVRAEAANWRTKFREAEAKISEAKTPEDIEAATSELRTTIADLERQLMVAKVAQEYRLPAELAEVLQGNSEDELKAHADRLAKFVPEEEIPPAHLEGGLTPGGADPNEALSPRELARRHARRR